MLCLCHFGPALLTFRFQTDLGRENSAGYFKIQAGKTIVFYTGVFSVVTQRSSPARKRDAFHFSHHSHALVTLYVQFLSSAWSKFDRWVHVENLYSIFNQRLLQSWFRTTCVVFSYQYFGWPYQPSWGLQMLHNWTYVGITILYRWRMSQ